VVDSAGDPARVRRLGADDPAAGARAGDAVEAVARGAGHAPAAGPRAYAGGARRRTDRTPDQIEELLRTSRQPISLDSTIGEDGETSIGDLIEDVDAPEASELVDRQLMAEQLRSALDALTPREATIMAMRFGLYDGNPHTLDEIGRALGLTRERIRQLEKQSLSKLRHPSRAQPLLDFAS
jgi:RNA polymerase sigma factor (sigma-70 family)